MENNKNEKVVIVAILAITGIEAIALLKGINGLMLAGSLVAISGLGGYTLKGFINKLHG